MAHAVISVSHGRPHWKSLQKMFASREATSYPGDRSSLIMHSVSHSIEEKSPVAPGASVRRCVDNAKGEIELENRRSFSAPVRPAGGDAAGAFAEADGFAESADGFVAEADGFRVAADGFAPKAAAFAADADGFAPDADGFVKTAAAFAAEADGVAANADGFAAKLSAFSAVLAASTVNKGSF
ncbi:MAG: hypothetical protein ABMA13_22145 [Chthoniobacteraceae bacterium]